MLCRGILQRQPRGRTATQPAIRLIVRLLPRAARARPPRRAAPTRPSRSDLRPRLRPRPSHQGAPGRGRQSRPSRRARESRGRARRSGPSAKARPPAGAGPARLGAFPPVLPERVPAQNLTARGAGPLPPRAPSAFAPSPSGGGPGEGVPAPFPRRAAPPARAGRG